MMLSSWSDIQQALKRYPEQPPRGDDVATFSVLDAGQGSVVFQIKFADIAGRPRIFIGTNLVANLPPISNDALIVNSELVVGAIAAFKGVLVLKHVMTVGGFDADELHEVIATLARSAVQIRERLTQQLPNPSLLYNVE